jgi:thiosulfate/3-mercaptopyruvate sulfurtransferase
MKARFLTLIAVLSLLALAVVPALAQDTPLEDYANPDLLVDTDWVLENLETPGVRILYVGTDREVYEAGHLPGSGFLFARDLTNPDDPVAGQIGTAEQVAVALGSLGLTTEDTIVLYDANSNLWAARAYWVLKYYQHADVRIYNGGVLNWQDDGQALSTNAPTFEAGEYLIGEADPEIRTTGDYVLENLDRAGVQLCDARSAEEFIGTDVRADVGGHIPGAINLDWVNTVQPDGTFLPAAQLDRLFQLSGFERENEIITYCQTGVRGAHVWFILRELLGYPSVRNYDGSWEEWGNTAGLPVDS